jgi:SAM-dependent methyltransferase
VRVRLLVLIPVLLDLACGPGRVAIPMAQHFERVQAVDVEAEMIAVGQRETRRRGVANIAWQVQRAEGLDIPPGSIELITVGEAFRRLDSPRVLQLAMQWLRPRGSLATLGGEPVWRGDEAWKRAVVDVVNAWTDHTLRDPNERNWEGPVDALRAAGLIVDEHEYAVERVWTCDSIVGFMFSTSIASRRVLGDAAGRFEADLRGALLECEPDGRFVCAQRFGFTLGRRAG